MALHKPVRRHYMVESRRCGEYLSQRKLNTQQIRAYMLQQQDCFPKSITKKIKYQNLHYFKEGMILLCQSIIEAR